MGGDLLVKQITQTALRCRVPGGMCYGWATPAAGLFQPGALARTMCFTVLCASDLRHSAVEWSLAPLWPHFYKSPWASWVREPLDASSLPVPPSSPLCRRWSPQDSRGTKILCLFLELKGMLQKVRPKTPKWSPKATANQWKIKKYSTNFRFSTKRAKGNLPTKFLANFKKQLKTSQK